MIYCRRHRLVERQDGVVGIMDQLKRVLAVLGAAFGSLAMLYLVFACSLTLKNFGLSVEDQHIAQRILTLLLLAALPVVIVLIKHVCLRLDLSSFAKMAVNSTTCAKCAKSLAV